MIYTAYAGEMILLESESILEALQMAQSYWKMWGEETRVKGETGELVRYGVAGA